MTREELATNYKLKTLTNTINTTKLKKKTYIYELTACHIYGILNRLWSKYLAFANFYKTTYDHVNTLIRPSQKLKLHSFTVNMPLVEKNISKRNCRRE
jgi:hypothetical protein